MEVNKLEDVINYAKETAKIFGRCYVAMMDYSSEDYFHIEQEIHRYREGLKKANRP